MKNLLVTLADKNHIEQAKQLFSSVYFNAGWKWDYMLLAHEIPEAKLKWFRNKAILIKKCKPIYNKKDSAIFPTHLSKFYLFGTEFGKWKNIIYLDSDIIVRASLDDLIKIKGFAAVQDFCYPSLVNQFKKDQKLINKLKNDYSLKKPPFNTGVMVFSTDIIKKDTFSRLNNIFKIYKMISITQEQSLLNLFFQKKWINLPMIYNIPPYFLTKGYKIKAENIKGIILHFSGRKPWNSKDMFYKEWKNNLDRAKDINVNKIQKPVKKWNKQEIKEYSKYLRTKHLVFLLNRYIGFFGIFLKNNFPKLYSILKKC